MKRLILLLLIFSLSIFTNQFVFAYDFLPRYMASVDNYGIGVYFAPKEIQIYSEPEEDADILDKVNWNELGIQNNSGLSTKETFIAFLPEKDFALFAVADDTDNWYQVIYNQKTGAKGWVKRSEQGKFMTWLEFMNKYGREKGVYFFRDLPEEYKLVHTGPGDDTQIREDSFVYPDQIKLKFVRGNWMLVQIVDYNKSASIGWLRWRDKEGKLLLFPDLSQ